MTRLTLIRRLASGGSETDWNGFLHDYWGPICRFALRQGARNLDDAEDVASKTLEVLWQNRLLARWISEPRAKLRTLLCQVVRNILANQRRVWSGRDRFWHAVAEEVGLAKPAENDGTDPFYSAWVEDLIQRAVEALAGEYYRQDRGDYVRVLYGRLCEQLTIAQVAETLEIAPSAVDNYYRHVRRRLSEKLEELVRRHVARYAEPEDVPEQFDQEWGQLGEYLAHFGGLEEAIRRTFESLDAVCALNRRKAALTRAATRLTAIIRASAEVNRRPGLDEPGDS
jgi:DNA-directed RNA polymerase specialized sigma24 family protein